MPDDLQNTYSGPERLGYVVLCGTCGQPKSWCLNDLLDTPTGLKELAYELRHGADTKRDVPFSQAPKLTCRCKSKVAR